MSDEKLEQVAQHDYLLALQRHFLEQSSWLGREFLLAGKAISRDVFWAHQANLLQILPLQTNKIHLTIE